MPGDAQGATLQFEERQCWNTRNTGRLVLVKCKSVARHPFDDRGTLVLHCLHTRTQGGRAKMYLSCLKLASGINWLETGGAELLKRATIPAKVRTC